eukprot:TRINITY_DN9674_c0_g1_i1.p1 TRINITY_DN9674_c0_g1~~TRINITY_DN9674_c0_g1_i1.p1  ORF type:complete len:250 (+),score=84.03 TRINITY_DN9674_c0_g1_i1:95-844(+)
MSLINCCGWRTDEEDAKKPRRPPALKQTAYTANEEKEPAAVERQRQILLRRAEMQAQQKAEDLADECAQSSLAMDRAQSSALLTPDAVTPRSCASSEFKETIPEDGKINEKDNKNTVWEEVKFEAEDTDASHAEKADKAENATEEQSDEKPPENESGGDAEVATPRAVKIQPPPERAGSGGSGGQEGTEEAVDGRATSKTKAEDGEEDQDAVKKKVETLKKKKFSIRQTLATGNLVWKQQSDGAEEDAK